VTFWLLKPKEVNDYSLSGFILQWNEYHHSLPQSTASNNHVNKCGKATLVTAFFPMNHKNSWDNYTQWISNLCSLRDPMIIFTPESMSKYFFECRARYHHENITLVVPSEIDDLDSVKDFGKQFWDSQLDSDPEGPKGKNRHKTSSVYPIWNEKTNFLKRGSDMNPFGSEFFAWVDVGYHRDTKYCGSTMISRLPADLSEDQILILAVGRYDGVGAGFIGGFRSGISRWHQAFYATLHKRIALKKGSKMKYISKWEQQRVFRNCDGYPKINPDDCYRFVGKEETTMKITCEEYPQLCYLVRTKKIGNPWRFMAPFLNMTVALRLYGNFSRSPLASNSTCHTGSAFFVPFHLSTYHTESAVGARRMVYSHGQRENWEKAYTRIVSEDSTLN